MGLGEVLQKHRHRLGGGWVGHGFRFGAVYDAGITGVGAHGHPPKLARLQNSRTRFNHPLPTLRPVGNLDACRNYGSRDLPYCPKA